MTALEHGARIARILKQEIEDARLTGAIDIHIDCSQGAICRHQVAVTEKRVSVFEFGNVKKNLADTGL